MRVFTSAGDSARPATSPSDNPVSFVQIVPIGFLGIFILF
jgi:hypothetical protein